MPFRSSECLMMLRDQNIMKAEHLDKHRSSVSSAEQETSASTFSSDSTTSSSFTFMIYNKKLCDVPLPSASVLISESASVPRAGEVFTGWLQKAHILSLHSTVNHPIPSRSLVSRRASPIRPVMKCENLLTLQVRTLRAGVRESHLSHEELEIKPEPVSTFRDFHRRRQSHSCFLHEASAGLLLHATDSSPDSTAGTNQCGFYSNNQFTRTSTANTWQTLKSVMHCGKESPVPELLTVTSFLTRSLQGALRYLMAEMLFSTIT